MREDKLMEPLTRLFNRTREGLILSKPSNNLDGHPEHKLRAYRRAEAVLCRQYKV